MAKLKSKQNNKLSIIIPTRNEAHNIPILLADLSRSSLDSEINIIDAYSSDKTLLVSKLYGAKVQVLKEANRGLQLSQGAKISRGDWLLFLHADVRMPKNWHKELKDILNKDDCAEYAWFFNFKLNKKGIFFRALELAVFIRSNLFKRPYGDQGLLISKKLYSELGGYKEIPIMEDIDLVMRILKVKKLRPLNIDIKVNGRRWEKANVFSNALKNALLRYRWRKGESINELFKDYYSLK